jgi:hypothetical protein
MSLAQFILDCFPDSVSDHGLIGCAVFTFGIASIASLLIIGLLANLSMLRR